MPLSYALSSFPVPSFHPVASFTKFHTYQGRSRLIEGGMAKVYSYIQYVVSREVLEHAPSGKFC